MVLIQGNVSAQSIVFIQGNVGAQSNMLMHVKVELNPVC